MLRWPGLWGLQGVAHRFVMPFFTLLHASSAKVCAGGEMDSDLIVAAEVWIVHSFWSYSRSSQSNGSALQHTVTNRNDRNPFAQLLTQFCIGRLRLSQCLQRMKSWAMKVFMVLILCQCRPRTKATLDGVTRARQEIILQPHNKDQQVSRACCDYDHFSHSRYWHQIILAGSCWQVRC